MISRFAPDASPPSLDVFVVLASPSPVTTAICIILHPISASRRHRVASAPAPDRVRARVPRGVNPRS